MSMSIMFNTNRNDLDAIATWTAIKTVASEDGLIFLSEKTIKAIARELVDAPLAFGGKVFSYHYEDNYMYDYVSAFGPSLLSDEKRRAIIEILKSDDNATAAIALFEAIISEGIKVSFCGEEIIDPHMVAINEYADTVSISMSSGNLYRTLENLGVTNPQDENNIAFDAFAEMVETKGFYLREADRLEAFVDCARRNKATEIYWA